MGQTGARCVSVLAPGGAPGVARLDVQGGSSPGLTQRLRSTGVVKLRQVVDVAGPGLHNTEAVDLSWV